MFLISAPLAWLAGNPASQWILGRVVKTAAHFMGVGAGTGVASSGEKVVFRAMRRHASEPYTVFDVGANQGQFLKLTLGNVGTDRYAVHCFEPGAQTYEILQMSQPIDERVTLNNMGLSREVGEAELHYDAAGSGLASLTKRELGHFGIDFEQKETVKLDTVDHYCAERNIEKIDLLKIDVEGHELDVLAGAQRMFDEKRVGVVTFEFGGCNIDTRTYFRDFWQFFSALDYQLFRITPSGYLFPIKKYRERDEQFRTTNFVATPRV